jgi:hypothetical protein
LVFATAPAAQSSALPAAPSGLKVQDRSHAEGEPSIPPWHFGG